MSHPQVLAPTKKRRRHHAKKQAPKRRRHTTRRKKGLSEGLSAGLNNSVSPIFMGLVGGVAGLIVLSFFKNSTVMTKGIIGAAGAFVSVAILKAPNFAAGFVSGCALPAVAQVLNPDNKTMNDGYLNEDLPEILDEGEYLNEAFLQSGGYLNENEFEFE